MQFFISLISSISFHIAWQRVFLYLLITLTLMTMAFSVEAATCQQIAGQQICLQRIKRSAKYYWEYRVALSIDGVKQPERIYDCRDRFYREADRVKVYFSERDLLGNSVCRIYQKSYR